MGVALVDLQSRLAKTLATGNGLTVVAKRWPKLELEL